MLSMIAAMGNQRVIGQNNSMPWHMPADLQHFKQLTLGKPILMGRRTFESIGRPLPGRRNLILTQQVEWQQAGCEVFNDIETVIESCTPSEELMVIGGASLYEAFLRKASRLYLTFIEHDFAGDRFFPEWDRREWQQVESTAFSADDKNPYSYRFSTWQRVGYLP